MDEVAFEVHIPILGMLQQKGNHFLLFDAVHVGKISVLHFLWKFDVHHFIVNMVNHWCWLSSPCLVLLIPAFAHCHHFFFILRSWGRLKEHRTPHSLSIVIQQSAVKSLNADSLTPVHISHNIARDREFLIDMVAIGRKRNKTDHLQHVLNSVLTQVHSS